MTAELHLFMGGHEDSDERERAALTAQLAGELSALGAVRHPPASDRPEGTKGTALEWTELLVTLVGTLPVVIQALRSWLDRRGRPTAVTLKLGDDEITLDSASDAEQQRLLRAFLERHETD